eukprot:3636275-Prymnesium_polylepis.1
MTAQETSAGNPPSGAVLQKCGGAPPGSGWRGQPAVNDRALKRAQRQGDNRAQRPSHESTAVLAT